MCAGNKHFTSDQTIPSKKHGGGSLIPWECFSSAEKLITSELKMDGGQPWEKTCYSPRKPDSKEDVHSKNTSKAKRPN